MTDLLDKSYIPVLAEISSCINNPVFDCFTDEIMKKYKCSEKIEYSSCSFERGWNVKFKKSGRTLCTIYPREGYFTVLVVIGKKEKERAEEILPLCSDELQKAYNDTKECGGQRWLMLDLEDKGQMYNDVLRLIDIRRGQYYA